MVWCEWIDDVNYNQWPDAEEYSVLGLYMPSDLSGLIG
jgi:hypothetical protein